jgi:pyruvate dehydrogenase E2 component (dihydrolipoamide acetyltransferase)
MLARELGVQLENVTGTGPRGRVQKDDVNNYVKAALNSAPTAVAGAGIPQVPAVDFSQFGDIETIAMSKIQKLTAANMQRNWLNVPHVTQFDEADITELESFRKSLKDEGEKRGIRITPVSFLIKALATSLQANPAFNRSLAGDGENYIQKYYCHVGMAVDTPRGLVVPVIKDADQKGIWDISAEIASLAASAREGKLKPAQMQGGCFTLSSLGAIGGTGFTPIVNSPEVGILGVSKTQMKPVWNGSDFAPRLMLPLALSYDHRVINGGDAGRFMTYLVKLLSDIRHLAL